ncbi:hypothetical protein EVAR_41143_1 [Eumeta japonica]|uniref:Uncharacterized protein n=1 Tax=Eumeta variegata TaxID=151549 RepID=A0A4C1YEN4_EUMVA|nr:hypothetical protein EVAR_41143_1 [Eumeta japonica]
MARRFKIWEFMSSTLSYPISGTCVGQGKSPKYTGFSSSRSTKVSSKSFPRLTSYSQVASLTLMSIGSSLERISAECRDIVRRARHALRATLRWTASSILRTTSFLFAGAQAHDAYRTIDSITVMYMVLTTSGLRPHIALVTRAKPL